jgi:hypothetical protein
MALGVVATDTVLQFVIGTLRNELNVGHSLRLFSNNYIPVPNSSFLDFQESSFPGYARWNLNGVFEPQLKVRNGEWAIRSPQHTFTCTGASPFAVFGWWMVKNGLVKFAWRFPALVSLGPGVDIPVKLTLEALALSMLQ